MTRSRRVAYLLSLIGWLACVTGAEAGRVDPVRARALWNAMPADGRRDLDWGHQLTHKPSTELRGVFVTQLEGGGSTTAFPHMRIRGKKVSGTWQLETVRARRDGLPWQRFETLPDLVEGRGTPPYLLTAVAHQRALGVEWGTLGRLVTDIQSPGVAMDFEVLRRGFVAQHGRSPTSFAEQAALLRQTHFVQSIESMLALSGHAVTGATLTG